MSNSISACRIIHVIAALAAVMPTAAAVSGQSLQLRAHADSVGLTPEVLGVNGGHFAEGSNTLSRVLYLRPNGMRLFLNGTRFVSRRNGQYDMEPWGDGVVGETGFRERRLALRADPLGPAFIDWDYYRDRLAGWRITGINVMNVPRVLDLLNREGIEILSQTTVSKSHLGFDGAGDWASRWEYWKFYYAYAFMMLDQHGIRKFQMYNEPNHSASGVSDDFPGYLERLRLASDAIQSAFADYNRIHSTAHQPHVNAPVLAGLNRDWTEAVASFMSVPLVDDGSGFPTLFHAFSYQRYNSAPIPFGAEATTARSLVAGAARRDDFEISLTEFNVHTASNFANMAETLDTPAKFARLGGIHAQLLLNLPDQLYAFKFNQTDGRDSIGIRKNGLAYVDNAGAPYDTGGLTGGFEVARLFNEAFAGRQQVLRIPSTELPTGLRELVHMVAARRSDGSYRLAIANESDQALDWNFDLAAWGLPSDSIVEIEEVSPDRAGELVHWQAMGAGGSLSARQPPLSVWMLRAFPVAGLSQSAFPPDLVGAFTPSRTVLDSPANEPLRARHHLGDPDQRSVVFARFDTESLRDQPVERAWLRLRGGSEAGADPAVYHVYAVVNGWLPTPRSHWDEVPWLRNGNQVLAAPRINANLVGGEETAVRLVGTFRSEPGHGLREHRFDVTRLLQRHRNGVAAFLISRDIRDTGDATVNSSSWKLDTGRAAPALGLDLFFDPRMRMPRMRASVEAAQLTLRWNQAAGQGLDLESAPHPAGPWSTRHSYPSAGVDAARVFNDPLPQTPAHARFYRLRPPAGPVPATRSYR